MGKRNELDLYNEVTTVSKDASLVIMAAGIGSRYGGNKQIDGIGPGGEILMEYSIFDALRAGFNKIVLIIKSDMVDMMKQLVGNRLEAMGIKVVYVIQDFSSIPAIYAIPADRTKPFGTCHAVLCARNVVREPFCVINADDYYGADAFRTAYKALCEMDDRGKAAMVGYRLKNTVSKHGVVSRGICKTKDGKLTEVVELQEIALEADDIIRDILTSETLDGESIVSMNFWCFTPWIFEKIKEYFHEFLKNLPECEIKAECLLPVFVDSLIRKGEMDVNVLHSDAKWFGMTYQKEKSAVAEALRVLHDAGEYPKTLR